MRCSTSFQLLADFCFRNRWPEQLPNLNPVCLCQPFECADSQFLFHPGFDGMIIVVRNAGALWKFLLCYMVDFPQLFQPVNEIFLCFTHINSFTVLGCAAHPTIGMVFMTWKSKWNGPAVFTQGSLCQKQMEIRAKHLKWKQWYYPSNGNLQMSFWQSFLLYWCWSVVWCF